MASVWQKTLFYLGLVDDDQIEAAEEASAKAPQAQVRTVEPPRPVVQSTTAAPAWRQTVPAILAFRRVSLPATAEMEPSRGRCGSYVITQ